MNIENQELIHKTTSVLDKIMNFFKKVVNKQTITDKGALHHAGELCEGAEVYQDEDMSTPAITDSYTTATGKKIEIKSGMVEKVSSEEEDSETEEEEDILPESIFKTGKHKEIKNRVQEIKAKLHAQNALLTEAKAALEEAGRRLNKTHTEIKNEIKSDFTPEGSKRSSKAKTETQPFFAPKTTLAQNAVKKAVAR